MKTANQLLDLIADDCAKNGGLILTHKGKQYLIEEAWVKNWDSKVKRGKTMQNKYTNALILTLVMIVSFVFLLTLSIYMEQPKKTPCSSYVNTNCEGYHAPMCERE